MANKAEISVSSKGFKKVECKVNLVSGSEKVESFDLKPLGGKALGKIEH